MTNNPKDSPANDLGKAKNKDGASSTGHDAQGASSGKLHDAADAVRSAASAAATSAGDAYGSARNKAGEAYDSARERASAARVATQAGIADNPLVALAGGLALGVVIGALLPRTQKEGEALGPIANRIADAARIAAAAAIDAGKQSLDEAGVNRDNARGTVDQIVDTAVKAASSARSAAADSVRNA